MDKVIEHVFRGIMYVFSGFTLEIVFSVIGIEKCLGYTLSKVKPRKYLEGFVSLYMIPIHGLGMLYGFEAVHRLVVDWPIVIRYLVWCLLISGAEALTGWMYDKLTGFYCWDYYKDSKYKVFGRGYTLWTLVPLWGVAGLFLEVYSSLMIYLSPYVSTFFLSR